MTRKRNLTANQKKIIQKEIKRLVKLEGTQMKLANKLGVSQCSISQFMSGYALPGEEICMKLFKAYGIALNILRPDIYNP